MANFNHGLVWYAWYAITSQITSNLTVCSTVCWHQIYHQRSTMDRIPLTKGQRCGKRFRVMKSSYNCLIHYNGVTMSSMASQITSLTFVYSTVYLDVDQRKHQSSASLAFVRGIYRWPVNSPYKGPVNGKCFHLMTSSCTHVKWRWRKAACPMPHSSGVP